ncbi:serine-rich adhesin for platelets isoform X4 [Magallana gigas]|uniref:serine-rich adhesin for platelets isoform X4 n=1 Tax=Magallana gigas TaxID=29159 RepID=UPI0033427E03
MKQQKLKVLIALTLTMLYFPSFLGNVQENTTLEVEYSPTVSLSKTQKTVEGQNLSITCSYSPGNPITTSLYWTKTNSVFRYNGQLLQIPNIGRKDSGTYVCHAENTYSSGKKGTANATIEIDVQYGPSLTYGQALKVSEGQSARMSTSVTSNPASNVSWSRDNLLVSTQQYVNGTTRYTIQKTQCTDTGPFQVVASNGVQSKQATKVFLYVYFRKVPTRSFITLEKEKSKVDIHMNEPSTCDEKAAAVEETQNISKSNQFKLIIFDIFKKKGRRKINYPTLETPYCVQINESPVTETNFTKTGKELYANTDEFAATTSDQNRGNTKSKQASDTESGNIGKKKAKHSTLETANWAKTNKSPFTENNFTKTKTGKELYANAEELAATACDQNRENTKSKIAGDTESGNSGKKKTKNSTLETPNWAKTNKSPFTETYFTKTKTGKELYANAEELAATACDQNRENTKSKIAGDTESGNSGKKKTKNSTLETPNWAKTNESPFTETSFPKTKTGKEIYANAEELAATACDQNRENTKSKIADDTESGNSGKKKTKNSTLETPNWAKTNESPFTETNFTKTKTGKELYANAEELAATACDQNRGNTKSKKEGETKSGYSEKTKSKPLVLPKPKKKLSKASKAFSYF